jgi:hypothetical protein
VGSGNDLSETESHAVKNPAMVKQNGQTTDK